MGYGPRLPKRVQFVRPVLLLPGYPVQEIHPGAPEGFRDIPPQTQMQLEHRLHLHESAAGHLQPGRGRRLRQLCPTALPARTNGGLLRAEKVAGSLRHGRADEWQGRGTIRRNGAHAGHSPVDVHPARHPVRRPRLPAQKRHPRQYIKVQATQDGQTTHRNTDTGGPEAHRHPVG